MFQGCLCLSGRIASDQHLIENHFVQNMKARFGQEFLKLESAFAESVNQLFNAAFPKVFQSGPEFHRSAAARHFRCIHHVVTLIAILNVVPGELQCHNEVFGMAAQYNTTIVRHVQGLVSIDGPRIGFFDSIRQIARFL